MHDSDGQKEQIAGLYHRVAALYGQVGPTIFAYAGQHLVERVRLAEGARVLDVGTGRGANLFPAAQAVGPRGQVIGIDLAAAWYEKPQRRSSSAICRMSLCSRWTRNT